MKKKCDNCLIGLRYPPYEIEVVDYNDLEFEFPDEFFNFCPFCGHRIKVLNDNEIKIF